MKNQSIKGAICFRSKRDATRQYAEWLAEETGLPLFDLRKEQPDLEKFDLLVLGSAVYVGKYYLKSWLEKNWPVIRDKQLLLFTVSGTAPDHSDIDVYFKNNLTPDMQERLEYFPLQGKLKPGEVGWLLRFFLKLAARVEKDPAGKKRMKEGFDFVERRHISPIVEAIRELSMAYKPLNF